MDDTQILVRNARGHGSVEVAGEQIQQGDTAVVPENADDTRQAIATGRVEYVESIGDTVAVENASGLTMTVGEREIDPGEQATLPATENVEQAIRDGHLRRVDGS